MEHLSDYCPWCVRDSAGNHHVSCPHSSNTATVTTIKHINLNLTALRLGQQLDELRGLLETIRNLHPDIEDWPEWIAACKSGAMDREYYPPVSQRP